MKDQIQSLFRTDSWGHRNGHVDIGCLHLYYRVTQHRLNEVFMDTFDVAAVEVPPEEQNKGHFKRFLEVLEEVADQEKRNIHIECVHTDRFANFFQKRGYIPCNISSGTHFYRPIGVSNG